MRGGRQAARAAAPCLTHGGAGTRFAASGWSRRRRRPGPLRPRPAFLPPRPPPPPAPSSRPRVLPTNPGAAGRPRECQRQPGECGRRAARAALAGGARRPRGRAASAGGWRRRGWRARLSSWARAAGRWSRSAEGGAPAPRRRHRRQSARGGSPAGGLCLRAACRVRPLSALPGRSRLPTLPEHPCSFLGERDTHHATGLGVNPHFPAGLVLPACGHHMRRRRAPGRARRPAPAAGFFVWPVTSLARWVGDARPRPPGRGEAPGCLCCGVGLGFPWACRLLTSLQPVEESQREGREGWQGSLVMYLFFMR